MALAQARRDLRHLHDVPRRRARLHAPGRPRRRGDRPVPAAALLLRRRPARQPRPRRLRHRGGVAPGQAIGAVPDRPPSRDRPGVRLVSAAPEQRPRHPVASLATRRKPMPYWRFGAMILTSTIVMFGLMYLNTYVLAHVFWSETRAYMALLMGATMAIIMLSFMLSMYSSKAINTAIFAGAAIAFAGSLWLVRSQATVGDTSFMRAMIPHHSIAIMTSSRANISDRRVRKLADEIIYAQDKEIAEMRYLVNEIEASGDASEPDAPSSPRIVSLQEALSTA